jgi:hypothetical protein
LFLQQFGRKIAIKAEEISQFSRSINLSLPDILALAQHRRCDEFIPVLGTDQVRCLEEYGRSVDEGRVLPILLGLQGRFNGGQNLLLRGNRVICEGSRMLGWKWLVP